MRGAWASRNALQLLGLLFCMVFIFAYSGVLEGVIYGLAFSSLSIGYAYMTLERKRDQREATEASQQAREGWQSYPVRYCSEKRFRSWWKLLTWEATGILSLSDEGVTLTTKTPGGATVERRFHPEEATIEWEGQNLLPNGVLSWFVIEQDGERVYFTSETGSTVFGSESSTREIYDRLLAR